MWNSVNEIKNINSESSLSIQLNRRSLHFIVTLVAWSRAYTFSAQNKWNLLILYLLYLLHEYIGLIKVKKV